MCDCKPVDVHTYLLKLVHKNICDASNVVEVGDELIFNLKLQDSCFYNYVAFTN